MPSFKRISIRTKLKLVILSTSFLSTVFVFAGFFVYEHITYRERLADDLSTKAEIIGENSNAALAFRDSADASRVLQSLISQPRITAAAIYDQDGKLFVSYTRKDQQLSFPQKAEAEGWRYHEDALVLSKQISLNGAKIGTIYLNTDLLARKERFRSYVQIALLVLVGSLLVAYLVATALERSISGPILNLAETAQRVSKKQDYSIRASKKSDDETGYLADAVNRMLAQIQERDTNLRLANEAMVGEIAERKRTESTLKESEERFRTLFQDHPLSMWVFDSETLCFVEVNEAAVEHYGYSRDEFLGMTIKDIRPQEEVARLAEDLAQHHKGLDSAGAWKHRKKNGELIDVEITSHELEFAGRNAKLVLANDITDRKRAEEARRVSEGRTATILKSALDAIITIDHMGVILEFNPAAEKISGYTRAEVMGKEMASLIIPPGLRERHRRGMAHYLTTGEGPVLGKHIELMAMRADGSELPVELSIMRVGTEVPPVFTGIMRDITERKRAEKDLLQFADIVESSHDAIIGKTLDGIITTWNTGAERIFGYAVQEAIGKPIGMLIPPDRIEEETHIINRIAKGEGIDPFETVRVRKDGKQIHVSVTISPIKDGQGNIIGASKIARDITERKQVEEALRISEHHKESLLRLSRKLERSQTFSQVLEASLEQLREVMGYRNIWAYLLSEDRETASLIMTQGELANVVKQELPILRVKDDKFLEAIFAAHGPVVVEDARIDPRTNKDIVAQVQNRTIINVPLTLTDQKIAALGTGSFGAEGVMIPDRTQLEYFSAMASHVGVAFDRIQFMLERKQAEERFRMVVESAPNAMVMVNREGKVSLINSQLEKLFGYSREELIGQSIEILVPERYRGKHGGYRAGFMTEPQARPMGAGRDLFGLRKDGTEFPVEIGLNPIETQEGTMVLGAVVDITERKHAERELRDSEIRYRTALDHMMEGCQIIGFDFRYLYINDVAAKQGRRTRGEFLGHTMMEIYPGIEHTEMFVHLRLCMEQHTPHRMESELIFPDGTTGLFDLSMEPVHQGTFILSTDITKEKQQDEELRKHREHLEVLVDERTAQLEAVNKELEAFSYSVSHDLRAPLRHINGFIGLLQKAASQKLDEQSNEYLTVVSDSAKRMGSLIDDLLGFSRMSRSELLKSRVSLDLLVREVIRELDGDAKGRQVDWKIGNLPVVEADRPMLRLAVLNLLSNALKYTRPREKAHIEVGCTLNSHNETIVYIRDNGVGFDMQYIDKLFGVFQRLHRADEFEGTGIGLANVRRIIQRHGGRTWAESGVGEGATFYFSLPKPTQKG